MTPQTATAPIDLDAMLGDEQEQSVSMDALATLAEKAALKQVELKELETQAKEAKKEFEALSQSLCDALMDNNCSNGHKFDSGINVKPVVKETVFKAGGVDDEDMFAYLDARDLGHIIKPTVHWQTLSSTMLAERDMGHEIPDTLFKVKEEHKIRFVGNGHIKFTQQQ